MLYGIVWAVLTIGVFSVASAQSPTWIVDAAPFFNAPR